MKPRTVEYYNWFEDLQPVILSNLNEILVAKGINPVRDLHGGAFKDGKWVGVLDSKDYRNYWHFYIELWGERLHNDQYQVEYFPHPDNDDEWDYLNERADKFADVRRSGYTHSDPHWPRDLVTAVRKMFKDHPDMIDDADGSRLVIWWSW